MPWVSLDDKFHSNQKILGVGDDGAGLYARALSYCGDQMTDGFVPKSWARTAPKRRCEKLTEYRLWHPVKKGGQVTVTCKRPKIPPFDVTVVFPSDGYYIGDYLELNPSRHEIEVRRETKAEAGRRGAQTRWGKAPAIAGAIAPAIAEGMANGMANGCESDAPLPLPLLEGNSPSTNTRDAAGEGRVINLEEGTGHALRLVAAMRETRTHRGPRIREQVSEYVGRVAPADFELVREQMLEHRHEIKSDGGWALKALQRIAREHAVAS